MYHSVRHFFPFFKMESVYWSNVDKWRSTYEGRLAGMTSSSVDAITDCIRSECSAVTWKNTNTNPVRLRLRTTQQSAYVLKLFTPKSDHPKPIRTWLDKHIRYTIIEQRICKILKILVHTWINWVTANCINYALHFYSATQMWTNNSRCFWLGMRIF